MGKSHKTKWKITGFLNDHKKMVADREDRKKIYRIFFAYLVFLEKIARQIKEEKIQEYKGGKNS